MSEEATAEGHNRKIKLEYIEAFFAALESKSDFFDKLKRDGHPDEALLLCCCYIDALGGHRYWLEERNNRNFVCILSEYGGEEVLRHIHPMELSAGLSGAKSSRAKALGQKLDEVLKEAGESLYPEGEILGLLGQSLLSGELATLRKNLWRGTLAALVYREVRSRLVHGFTLGSKVWLGSVTFRGKPVPDFDLELLNPVLRRIIQALKELSVTSGKWFGHDFKRTEEGEQDKDEGN